MAGIKETNPPLIQVQSVVVAAPDFQSFFVRPSANHKETSAGLLWSKADVLNCFTDSPDPSVYESFEPGIWTDMTQDNLDHLPRPPPRPGESDSDSSLLCMTAECLNSSNQGLLHPTPTHEPDGTVHTERKPFRPNLISLYQDPDLGEDLLDGQELIFKEYGSSLRHTIAELPPRNDIIFFDVAVGDQEEFDRNIRWRQCPEEYKPEITDIIHQFWDVFCERGIAKNIRGFSCRVDTGDCRPVCCKPPRYGPHEAIAIRKLVDHLEFNGLIEDDDGPWGSLIVLAAKAGQEGVPWHQYVWRLCVSYRRMNQVVRPFKFPILRCDDAVTEIPPFAKYFLMFDLDCGYWQVALDKDSRAKTAFFAPEAKKHWLVMPMGFLNAHAIFVAMMQVLKKRWNADAEKKGIQNVGTLIRHQKVHSVEYGASIIVDDVLLYAASIALLLAYFRVALITLQHYSVTIKLKKCKFLDGNFTEFVGMDIGKSGNAPATSKFKVFQELKPPLTWTDLRMVIGMFGFYAQFLPCYEVRIIPFRKIQAKGPRPGFYPRDEEEILFIPHWLEEHNILFYRLIDEVISGACLARPDYDRRFFLKTDWSALGMGAALLQLGDYPDSRVAERAIELGGSCAAEFTKSGIRLRPVHFISRATTDREQRYHSYVGEASVGRWAMEKLRHYILGREFTWLSDCTGLKRFFERVDDIPTHIVQRWRAELLQFNFVLENRPESMMTECNLLSRYNLRVAAWQTGATEPPEPVVAATTLNFFTPRRHGTPICLFPLSTLDPTLPRFRPFPPAVYQGDPTWKKPSDSLSASADLERVILVKGAAFLPLAEATTQLDPSSNWTLLSLDDDPEVWRLCVPDLSATLQFFELLLTQPEVIPVVDWYMAVYPDSPPTDGVVDDLVDKWVDKTFSEVLLLLTMSRLRAAILITPNRFPDALSPRRKNGCRGLPDDWAFKHVVVNNVECGGPIETNHSVLILAPSTVIQKLVFPPVVAESMSMEEFLDPASETSADHFLRLKPDIQVLRPDSVQQRMFHSPLSPLIARFVKPRVDPRPIHGYPVFDIRGPAPSIRTVRPEEPFFMALFGLWFDDLQRCRPCSMHELLRLLGFSRETSESLEFYVNSELILHRARACPGRAALATVLATVRAAETSSADVPDTSAAETSSADVPVTTSAVAFPVELLPALVYPLPSDEQWRHALSQDPDLALLIHALTTHTPVYPHQLNEKTYFYAFRDNLLEVEDQVLYYYEHSKTARLRQLRLKVVPFHLRRVVIAACHSSPFAGHSSITRTLFRLQTRFWWAGLVRDVTEGVRGCAHCNLANATSHESQLQLQTLACDVPFDVQFLDFWSPGDMPDKWGNVKVLTMLDCMTGFAMATFLTGIPTVEEVASMVMSTFFCAIGLPRLIIVDADSWFAGGFKELCSQLHIPVEAVSPENHKAIRNERFHRFLNKLQKINTADSEDSFRWKQGTMFAIYAWNAAPVAGTDISRSYCAVGREFPFPIDLGPAVPHDGIAEGQSALDHVEASSPLLYSQRQLFNLLTEERRLYHAELKNSTIKQRTFDVGDIVIVRRQVQSSKKRGISAKLVFRTFGPYRVIQQVSPNSYKIQKLPFVRGLGVRGKLRKESAARMTKIPSTMVLHKRADGADTRFSLLGGHAALTPLQKWLGVLRCGAYKQAPGEASWAYEPVASLWSDPVEDEEPPSDSSDNDSNPEQNREDDTHDVDFDGVDSAEKDDVVPEEGDEEETDPVERLEIPKVARAPSARRALRQLYDAVYESQGRFFFIAVPGENRTEFRLAQVDWNLSRPFLTRQHGIYAMRWYARHPQDAKERSWVDSRFWPALVKVLPDGQTRPCFTRPDKVASTLLKDPTIQWPLFEVNLAGDRIVGPFDLSKCRYALQGPQKRGTSETHHVDPMYWNLLETHAPEYGVILPSLRIVPIVTASAKPPPRLAPTDA